MIEHVKSFHGLTHVPFCKSIGTSQLYECTPHNELIARLEMALQTDDLALVTGASGSGKSSALRRFADTLDPVTYPCAYISSERYRIGELCKVILSAFKLEVPFHGYAALSRLKKEIEKWHKDKNAKPVIIIDEAQELLPKTLLSLKNLTNYEMDSNPNVLIILCGHNELETTIGLAQFESLARRIRIRYRVNNLSLSDINTYIRHQLDCCGAKKEIFAEEAIASMYNATKGNISLINNICFGSLIAAASENSPIIGQGIVEKVQSGM